MKKIKYIMIIVFLLGTISCKDFLDAVPYSFTSPENFYQSAEEAEMALTGVYNILNTTTVQGTGNLSTYGRNLGIMLNCSTDEAVVIEGYNEVDFTPWGNAGFTADNALIDECWFFFYAGINRANYLIESLSAIDDFSGDREAEVEGEARLLRGFYHMILAMMHGGVPVYTTSIQDATQERQSVEVVYAQIIEDYEFAYANLPDRADVSSHVNKWTAAGLLAKAHTYLASAKNSGLQDFGLEINNFDWVDADSHYQKALAYTTTLIAESGYELISNYDYLFRETTKTYQYDECLLSAEASTSSTMEVINHLVLGFCPKGAVAKTGGGYGKFRPTGEIYNKYSDSDIRFGHNLTGKYDNDGPTEEIDGVNYYIPNELSGSPNTKNYSIGKYRMMDPAQKAISTWASSINLPLLRYADILLLHAEAQYFTGDETGARNTLSIIRQRAVEDGVDVAILDNAYYNDDFTQELLDERSRELCYEEWRRFDLARFNKYDEVIENMSSDFGYYNTIVPTLKQNWESEKVWFPIPLAQIDLNQNLVQNSGY